MSHPFRVVADLRPGSNWAVYSALAELPSGKALRGYNFAIRWDEDNDPRIFGALAALYYRKPHIFTQCVGFSEHEGELTVWLPHLGHDGSYREALHDAVDGLPVAGDCWTLQCVCAGVGREVHTFEIKDTAPYRTMIAAEDDDLLQLQALHTLVELGYTSNEW
jgi:hypothetical protein